MCINASLIFLYEDPACGCHCSHAFVGWNKYQGAGGCDRAVSMSGKGALEPLSAWGGAMGGLGGLALWDCVLDDPDAGRPGLDGLVAGWATLTKSSPDESDLLSDSGIWWSLNGAGTNCVDLNSFAGN